ncbi:MAG: glycogen/starch/alpha-glucan phosphorylase [Chlamydiia bacterium]|nr:glycogen/starch/alpha-glucan phosphorylase [Chlamydiia bacterium]
MPEFTITKSEQILGDAPYLKQAILEHLHFTLGKDKYTATKRDLFMALSYSIRDQLIGRWIHTQQGYYEADVKRVYYLSLEFLIGQTLHNSLINLGLYDNCLKAVHDLGKDLKILMDVEADAGLGNGGLGRLAACFLDSMATLNIPGYGYGIRYDYGIFTQQIQNGYQIETPDQWLRYGNPWELPRTEYLYPINYYGRVRQFTDKHGNLQNEWVDAQEVYAMAYDTPIPGYQNDTVNTLRLWQAKSPKGFDLSYFNHGDYIRAVEDIAVTENITKVLYPNDNVFEGRELRLKQEYFLVSATLQDILRRYNKGHLHLDMLPDKVAIQLNDTHPALAIPEMMRLLIDREELSWEKAWQLTTETFAYTNHTLLPEALERWSVPLIEKVLPRHLQIIYEINARWLQEVERRYPGDDDKKRKLSIIEERTPKKVNMAHLALVGSRKINGVSALHSNLLKHQVFAEYYNFFPNKFTNKTNGITPRRWLKMCNPELAALITETIGSDWVTQLDDLHKIEFYANDVNFRERWNRIKRQNKERLAEVIFAEHALIVDPDSLFDVQVKRIHEYKRQLLNALHAISRYFRIKENPQAGWVPRTIMIGGKAAPGYYMAKSIIHLINAVGQVVNHDPQTKNLLKVIFLANYRVSLAEKIMPAADLSEQLSTAGTEASGTGNMKFALNGALTIGTLDGANIEMKEEIGQDNMFIFGLKADEVQTLRTKGYDPLFYYNNHPDLKRTLDAISDGYFSGGDTQIFQPIINSLLHEGDPYCLLADYPALIHAQNQVDELYKNRAAWIKKSIINVARVGKFSSDRTIKEYAREIWRLD